VETIHLDKKIKEGEKSRFVLLKDIGKAIVVENVTDEQIRQAIEEGRKEEGVGK
jgi:3-dehydroquinate synthetase